jgi:hypothetical protein
MYNTGFEVKYHDIMEELTYNLKNNSDNNPDNKEEDCEYEYTSQDILDICDKLYMDELCSVFYSEDILDDKIDRGMKYVFEKMLDNQEFKIFFNKMKDSYFNETFVDLELTEEEKQTLRNNSHTMVILNLFSKELFYITHKCICQQINTGVIDASLIGQLFNSI